jgi:outer membrane protein
MTKQWNHAFAAMIVVLVFAASPSNAAIGGDESLSLGEAQAIAAANHPDIRVSVYDERAVKEGLAIATSIYRPQVQAEAVSAFAPPGTRIAALNALNDPTVIGRFSTGISVSQYVTDFGRTADLVRAAELDADSAIARGAVTREEVALAVDNAYFEILRAEAMLAFARNTVGERELLQRRALALQRAGLRSMLDVDIARRDVATARQLVLAAQGRLDDQHSALAQALGENQVHPYHLRDVATLPHLAPLESFLSRALAENPALTQARADVQAAGMRASAAARATLPTLNAFGFFGVTPYHDQGAAIGNMYNTIGLHLDLPLFTGGALPAERRQADDLYHASRERARSEENQILSSVRQAYGAVETAWGNINLSVDLLRTADDTLRLTQARYDIGLASIVDLSETELRDEQAHIDALNARYDYIVQAAALEFAAGSLLSTQGGV